MTPQERLLLLDRKLNEVQEQGGQVWVEANWQGKRVLLCHHVQPRGKFEAISVMVPEGTIGDLVQLVVEMCKEWGGELIFKGTFCGQDPTNPENLISAEIASIDPSKGGRKDQTLTQIHAITRGYAESKTGKPFMSSPRIVRAEVVIKGE